MITPKQFTFVFLGFMGIILIISMALYLLDIAYTSNDVIRQYQMQKIQASAPVNIIIVGDSSAGLGIDAGEFSKIIGQPTLNLALTGSFGIAGSYNVMRHAVAKHPVKTVIFMHTLTTWKTPFSTQGFLESLDKLPIGDMQNAYKRKNAYADILQAALNPQEILWYIQHLRGSSAPLPVIGDDYFVQHDDQFSNGKKTDPGIFIAPRVERSNRAALTVIGTYCTSHAIQCLIVHGPILSLVYDRSRPAIKRIEERIQQVTGVVFVPFVSSVPIEYMGDTVEHVAPAYKKEMTRRYAETLKPYIKN